LPNNPAPWAGALATSRETVVMTLITEPVYTGEFVLSEGPRGRSRDEVAIGENQTLNAGTVLGLSSVGTLAAAFAALGANTGNPTCGAITVAPGTEVGEFDFVMDDATHFHMLQPPGAPEDVPGEEVGHGVFGVEFNAGGLGFEITAGGVACVPGDSFKITVTQSGALNLWVRWNPAATDGSQNAAAISFAPIVTPDPNSGAATVNAVVIDRDAEVKSGVLDWGAAEPAQIAAATAQLAALGIIVR
jgi:Bacteriophage lambda head decoration protein D